MLMCVCLCFFFVALFWLPQKKIRAADAARGVFIAHRCALGTCTTFDRDIRSQVRNAC